MVNSLVSYPENRDLIKKKNAMPVVFSFIYISLGMCSINEK